MVRDVAPRFAHVVAAEDVLEPAALALAERLAEALLPRLGADDELEQVEDRPVLDRQPAVHIGFADPQPGIAENVHRHPAVVQLHSDMLAAARPMG